MATPCGLAACVQVCVVRDGALEVCEVQAGTTLLDLMGQQGEDTHTHTRTHAHTHTTLQSGTTPPPSTASPRHQGCSARPPAQRTPSSAHASESTGHCQSCRCSPPCAWPAPCAVAGLRPASTQTLVNKVVETDPARPLVTGDVVELHTESLAVHAPLVMPPGRRQQAAAGRWGRGSGSGSVSSVVPLPSGGPGGLGRASGRVAPGSAPAVPRAHA